MGTFFYRICRILTFIVIALAVLFLLSKALPYITDAFRDIRSVLSEIYRSARNLLAGIF